MTAIQKKSIDSMRLAGASYSQIASALDISVNTVKAFCRRNSITGTKQDICRNCGLSLGAHKESKVFCSDKCRYQWWNAHRLVLDSPTAQKTICANCSKEFSHYAGKQRIYCSHKCYINARFRKELAQ